MISIRVYSMQARVQSSKPFISDHDGREPAEIFTRSERSPCKTGIPERQDTNLGKTPAQVTAMSR